MNKGRLSSEWGNVWEDRWGTDPEASGNNRPPVCLQNTDSFRLSLHLEGLASLPPPHPTPPFSSSSGPERTLRNSSYLMIFYSPPPLPPKKNLFSRRVSPLLHKKSIIIAFLIPFCCVAHAGGATLPELHAPPLPPNLHLALHTRPSALPECYVGCGVLALPPKFSFFARFLSPFRQILWSPLETKLKRWKMVGIRQLAGGVSGTRAGVLSHNSTSAECTQHWSTPICTVWEREKKKGGRWGGGGGASDCPCRPWWFSVAEESQKTEEMVERWKTGGKSKSPFHRQN